MNSEFFTFLVIYTYVVIKWSPLSVSRKMQVSGAPDLASKLQGFSDSSSAKIKDEIEDPYRMDKIQCPCGSTLQTDSMIKVLDTSYLYISCLID